MLFDLGGNALERLAALGCRERCLAVFVKHDLQRNILDGLLPEQCAAVVDHLGLHAEREAHRVGIARVDGKVRQRRFDGFVFACDSL